MCYMVSSFPPPKNSELNIMGTAIFGDETLAKQDAEEKLHHGHQEVRVWKLVGSPILIPTVEWK